MVLRSIITSQSDKLITIALKLAIAKAMLLIGSLIHKINLINLLLKIQLLNAEHTFD